MPPVPHPKRPEIAALLREGALDHQQIADRLGVTCPLVAKVAREERILRGRGRHRGEVRDLVLALDGEGLDSEEIALALAVHKEVTGEGRGVSRRLVQHYLAERAAGAATRSEER